MSSKHIWLLTFVAVFVFALGLAFIAGNAEGADGGGSVNVDKTWVRAGQAEHYSFTYDPEDDFTGTNPGIRLTIPEVDQVLYPDWDPGSPTFHGWTTPQKTTSTARGYVWVSDVYDVVWSGAVITLENAPGHTYSGRRINVTFSSNLPESDEIVVIHYGSDTQSAKPLAQRHIEDDVYFRVESDENGDGQFVVTDTNLENPNVDVLPSNPYKLVMTILPDQTYDPNPYTTPTTYHDTDVIADKTVGVPFNVEFRLVDIYGNLVNDPDVSTYAFGDHNIRIRGAGISECDFIPIITDNALASIDWYTGPPPDATTQQDIEMEFFGGQVRWLIGYSGFDPIYRWNHSMTLYKAETEIELYSKIQPLVGGGKYEYETPSFDVVGITAPITKVYRDPTILDGQDRWITNTTEIYLHSTGLNESGVGIAYIQYRIWYDGAWTDWINGTLGKNVTITMADLNLNVNVSSEDDCKHYIEYRVKDKFCNPAGDVHEQTFYVDTTPPDTSTIKVIGDPQYDDTSIIWVTTSTSFTFDITPDPDEGCEGGVGLNFTMYRIYLYGTTPGAWIKWDGDPIYMPEECHHVIEWYGVDLLGNTEDPANYQEHYVDITPPDTSTLKVIGDPQWQSPAGGIIWVTTGTSFNFDISSDPDEGCEGGVGLDAIWYRIYLKGSTPGSWIKWDGNPIYMPEECHHVIEWYGVDLLGNTEDPVNYQEHYVDDTPPDTYDIKEIGEPQWQAPAGGPIWNSPATEFSFNTTIDPDDGCEGGVGLDYIMYRILRWDEGLQEWIVEVPWTLYTGVPFYITTECNHRLEWYGVDLLGNKEIVNEQFHNIDITPPRILKSYGSPEWVEGGERWITKDTPIYLEAYDDQGLCNVGSVYLYYRIWYDGTWGPWLEVYEASGGVSIDFTLAQLTQVTGYEGFDEDCLHHIEYYAKDNIGNLNMSDTGYWNQSFWVDNTPPAVTKEYGTPFYVDSYGNDYITNKTMIWINGTDEGTCAVGSYTIYVRIWYDGVWSDWWYRTPHSLDWDFTLENWWAWIGEPPHVVDDCMHHIEIVVEDNLGNWNGSLFEGEPAINQTFYVDNTPPETLKEFEGFTYGQDDEFLSVDTLIWLNATDPEPCASGVKEIHWETWWLNAAGEWELEDSGVHQGDSVNVSFIQACNHKLVWWAVDNVSNVEEKNVQYHKVDDAPPTVVKEFEGFGYMDYNWLSTETIIWLNATDNPEGCWVGVYYIAYRLSIWDAVTEGWIYGSWVYVYDGMTGDLDPTYGNISVMTHFEEMCHHMIEFMAQDYLGHVSEITRQTHNVDPLPPTVTKEFEGPTYPEGDEANFWVTQNTIVWLNATDEPEICAAGVQNIGWRVWTDGVWYPSEGYWEYDGNTEIIYNQTGVPFFNYTKAITFTENCTHFIEYWARDFVCHYTVLHNQTYYVDWTAPTTFKEYGLDQDYGTLWGWCDVTALCEACELEVRNAWVTSDQYIYLYAEDDGCEGGIGTATVWFRIWYNGSWTQWYHGPEGQNYASFNMYGMDQYLFVTEKGDWVFNESLHIIEYYSVDCVGNVEQTHSQTFYVDNEDPIPEITNPVGITEEVEYDGFYYRPGYVFDPVLGSGLNYTESTGDEICYYQWSFSVPGNSTWIMIEEGCGDGKQVKWDTGLWADILEPWICSDEPNPILVKLKIWDEHCRNETSTIKIYFCREENPKPCTQIITIGQGWNLISIAVELDSLGGTYTASILAAEINSQAGENIVKYIVRWNAGTGKFNEYVVDNAIGYDFPIEKGEGYYVYSLSPFEVDFTIVGDCAECEYINLEICWNLVGWDSMDWMWVGDFVDLVNGIAGADVVQAVVRHVADDQYEAWYPGDDDYMFRMTTNNAYWVFVAQPVSNIPLP